MRLSGENRLCEKAKLFPVVLTNFVCAGLTRTTCGLFGRHLQRLSCSPWSPRCETSILQLFLCSVCCVQAKRNLKLFRHGADHDLHENEQRLRWEESQDEASEGTIRPNTVRWWVGVYGLLAHMRTCGLSHVHKKSKPNRKMAPAWRSIMHSVGNFSLPFLKFLSNFIFGIPFVEFWSLMLFHLWEVSFFDMHGTNSKNINLQWRCAEVREITVSEHDSEQLRKFCVDFVMHTLLTGAAHIDMIPSALRAQHEIDSTFVTTNSNSLPIHMYACICMCMYVCILYIPDADFVHTQGLLAWMACMNACMFDLSLSLCSEDEWKQYIQLTSTNACMFNLSHSLYSEGNENNHGM